MVCRLCRACKFNVMVVFECHEQMESQTVQILHGILLTQSNISKSIASNKEHGMIQVATATTIADAAEPEIDDIFSTESTDVDQEVCRRIQRSLQAVGYQSLSSIQISAVDGHIRFHGRVRSYYLKQVAQQSVIGMEGVKSIDNDLIVLHSKPSLS